MNMLNKVQRKYIYLLSHLSLYSGDPVKGFPAAFYNYAEYYHFLNSPCCVLQCIRTHSF